MTLISIEEAKTRLADCNILLKYMVFLQKNGLSDCGKGQIIGQASLLQEYLKEEEQQEKQQENKQSSTDKSSEQQKEQQQAITKDADKVGRMLKATFRENAVNNSSSKSDLLRQVGSVIDKAKHTVEQNKEREIEGPNKQAGQILAEPINDATTENDNKSQQIGGLGTNKEKNQSWINKIKKVTEVENWQSWQ